MHTGICTASFKPYSDVTNPKHPQQTQLVKAESVKEESQPMCLQLYKCIYYVHEKKHQCCMPLPCPQSRAAPLELLRWPGLDKGCPECLLPAQEVAQILNIFK